MSVYDCVSVFEIVWVCLSLSECVILYKCECLSECIKVCVIVYRSVYVCESECL